MKRRRMDLPPISEICTGCLSNRTFSSTMSPVARISSDSFLKWIRIAFVIIVIAVQGCDSSSASPGSDAASPNTSATSPIKAGENTGGTPIVNTASISDTTTVPDASGGDGNVAGARNEAQGTGGTAGENASDGGTIVIVVDAATSATGEDAAVTLTEDATVATEELTAEEIKMIEMYEDDINSYDAATIDPLYNNLDAVPKEFLVGTWKGGVFEANAPNPQNWYGKRIYPDLTAEAWLTIAADGGPGPNDPIMGGGGLATIREEEFRGTSSAVLVYANQVVKDYFRKIRGDYSQPSLGDIVIGFSTFTNDYFHLTRTAL